MREDYRLLTPENVELRYDVAGVGSRLLAALIDYVLLYIGMGVLILGFTFLMGMFREGAVGIVISAVSVLVLFLAWSGYFVLFELLWNGQTPGKRRLGLRVVRQGGQSITVMASLIRNVLRVIDVALYIGVAVMLFDRSSRRLGDFAAGTLVIREPRGGLTEALRPSEIPEIDAMSVDGLLNAHRITAAHYTLIRDFFARSGGLQIAQAERLAQRLAADVARDLDLPEPPSEASETLLATVARAYERRQIRH